MTTLTEPGDTETLGGVLPMVAVELPKMAGFMPEIALMTTTGLLGAALGAVKRPALVMVPSVAPPPVTPFTCHVRVSLGMLEVALNCWVAYGSRVTLAGVTTTTSGVVMVTEALPTELEFAAETADTVTTAGFGIAAGAV